MRLLVMGANGQVGWELSRSLLPLGEVIALDRCQCDLSRPERLPALIRSINPDVIVNAAAYTAVDKAEDEEALAMIVNGTAVGVLAEEARIAGAFLVHYSTDYVFDGTKKAPYTEEDAPNPINAYGRSKLAGETAVRQVAGGAYIILRTSWVYAARGNNFVQTVLRLAREREELRIVGDQVGAPTWGRNIADATALIVRTICRERTEGQFESGLFNLTASGDTSWYGFAETILEQASEHLGSRNEGPKLQSISSVEYPLAAARPRNSRLTSERLLTRFGIVLPNWQRALALCMQDIVTFLEHR